MDFDWSIYDEARCAPCQAVEECFEDPFSLRLMPDLPGGGHRFFCLGQDTASRHWLVVYDANGKQGRVIFSREMTGGERSFYERKLREGL